MERQTYYLLNMKASYLGRWLNLQEKVLSICIRWTLVRFGYFLAPLSVGLITSKNYFNNNINGATTTNSSDDEKPKES